MPDPDATKAEVRARVRAVRSALTPSQRARAAEAIAERALGLPEVAGARSVLAYRALAEEADPGPLVEQLRSLGARVALPRVAATRKLELHWVEEDDVLVPGGFGLLEPDASAPVARPDELDLVIVPGVAFDAHGCRLGYGGGFYDSLLPRLSPGAAIVAIAFDEQIVASLPCESHDVKVDVVVTPEEVIRRD